MAAIPPTLYPLGDEIDYTRLLVRTYTEWFNESMTAIRRDLAMFNDSAWSDSLFEKISASWVGFTEKAKPVVNRIMKRVSDRNFIRFSKQVEAATDKRVILALNPFYREPWLDLFMSERVAENIRLIKDIGAQSASRLQTILDDGIRTGKSTKAIAQQLREQFDYGKNRAKLIARDQIGKHNGLLTELRQKNAGVDKYIWSTSRDERVRPKHRVRDGNEYTWDNPPDDGNPGQPISCRCSALPVFPPNIFENLVNP